jgi:hypothetical protein
MSNFDVNCPIGYGAITFIGGGTGRYCPVSGKATCVECDVRPSNPTRSDNRPLKVEGTKKS